MDNQYHQDDDLAPSEEINNDDITKMDVKKMKPMEQYLHSWRIYADKNKDPNEMGFVERNIIYPIKNRKHIKAMNTMQDSWGKSGGRNSKKNKNKRKNKKTIKKRRRSRK